MMPLSYPVSDSSTFSHTIPSFLLLRTRGFTLLTYAPHFCNICYLFISEADVLPEGEGTVLVCLALNSSRRFNSQKGSAGNPICFLTRETWLCVLVRDPGSKAGVCGWDDEKLHRLCRRVILEKKDLSNRVHRIIYRSAEW